MKILVCGGRTYGLKKDEAEIIFQSLDLLHDTYGITCLVVGCANGADTIAYEWAKAKGNIIIHKHEAEWKKYGKKAGVLRNIKMLEENEDIELVVAFPGGKGTADMVNRAKRKNKEVVVL